jgi:KDO2-lipid IV(A) lauroyltransferase
MLARVIARLPRWLLFALGAAVASVAWWLGIRRRVVLDNLALAFPDRSEAERMAIARATYRWLGRLLAETWHTPSLPPSAMDRIFRPEGWEHMDAARARGKGVILCTAHMGNFEMVAAGLAMRGFPLTIVTRRMGRNFASDLIRNLRARSGVDELVATRGQTLQVALRALKEGRVLGYVIDQNQPAKRAVFPTFFGVPAATSPTPAILALRTGAPVIFAVTIPEPDGNHRVFVEGPLDMPRTGNRDRDVLAFMQDLNDRLERRVRQCPEAWYWLHRRWKTQPAVGAAGH